MDKKTILIVGLLVVLLLFYYQILEFLGLYTPPPDEPITQNQEQVDSTYVDTTPKLTVTDQNGATQTATMTETDSVVTSPVTVDTIPVDTLYITTNKYKIALSSLGGGPVSLLLNDYTYRSGEPIEMLPDNEKVTPDVSFAGGTFSTSDISFTSSLLPGDYSVTSDPLVLTYTYNHPDGGQIVRTFTFFPDTYHYDLTVSVTNPQAMGLTGRYSLVWNTPLGVTEPQPKTDYDAMEAVAMMGGSREKLNDFEDGKLKQSLDGYTTWAGVRNKYFTGVFIPQNREAEAVFARGTEKEIALPDGENVNKKEITAGIDMLFAGSFVDSFEVFVGPLDYNIMTDYNVGLEDMLDIGTTPFVGWLIKIFAVPIMWVLPAMYKIIPNYGVVIILFALLVKIITLPLSMKSFKSMNAMKEVQPKIDELRKKYKKDAQKMNSEIMKLYKEHGVNPMSGCLPMLPQMPLFFAMFSVFRSTILLRDAPFFWFIDDLSRGATSFTDPLIILVLFMIGAQFISQKLTMSGGQQQKAFMYIMPFFMGFIFYQFASGLVLYWACFSLFSLIDYFLFKRKSIKNPEVKTVG